MKVLFINIDSETTYPTGIAAVSAFIKREGHHTKLIEVFKSKAMLDNKNLVHIKKEVLKFKPNLVGFTVFETSFHWVRQICDFLKKIDPKILTVAGGYFPTLCPEEVIKHPSIDILCRGEGEHALLELVNGKDIKNIRNLWVKQNGEIHRNEIRPLIENLDDLPFWDREMFDFQKHTDNDRVGGRNVKIMASRGCPYKCTYCSNQYFRALYPNPEKYVRIRTVAHLIEELKYLKNSFDFDYMGFHDDNLTLYSNWLQKFSEVYSQEIGIPFYCSSRPENATDKNLDALKKAGCFMMLIGVESGNEQFRKNVLHRNISNKEIEDCAKRIKKCGIKLWTFNMVGMPLENRWMVIDTVKLNWKIKPDFGMTTIYYPFRGTEMGDYCYKHGLVDEKKKERVCGYGYRTILNHPNLSHYSMLLAKLLITLPNMKHKFFWKTLWNRISGYIIRMRKR